MGIHGNTIVLHFKYHPTILNAVREIDGRRWNPDRKQWEVPVENIVDCVDNLRPLGFTVPPYVLDAYTKRKAQLAAILDWKANPLPYTGVLPLFDFQKTGASLIKGLPAFLLADVPGLGKTLQVLAGCEGLNGTRLVFCPASLKYNWRDEIKKWSPDSSVVVIDGTAAERKALWNKAHSFDWVIANYELLLRDLDVMPKAWAVIVCDEADRISNPFAKTTRALKKLSAHKRLALSGTPISNRPDDLWSIVDWLYPRMLGSFTQFQSKYCKLHPVYHRVIGYQNLEILRSRIEPIMLRRLKEDVFDDFPEKTVENICFDLSREERELYDNVRKAILDEVRKETSIDTRSLALIPVKMLRLKQVTDHSGLIGTQRTSTKLTTLKTLLEPIEASGEKAIVFTQFSSMAKILKNELPANSLVISGETPVSERKEIIDEFNTNPDIHTLIMTEAGAYGLNIQSATYIVHYDAPWSLGKIEQREGRAHRIGQKKSVTVYHLIAKNSIDEYVLKTLSGKRKMSNDILGDDDPPTLTFSDIEEILED